jgi:hypothetical protein
MTEQKLRLSHMTFPQLVGLVILGAAVIFLLVIPFIDKFSSSKSGVRTEVDQARVAKNRAAIEKCSADLRLCIGGFYKSRDHTHITRIDVCGRGCRNWETDASDVKLMAISDHRLNKLEYIVLPNEPFWEAIAILYSRQFIDPSQRKP